MKAMTKCLVLAMAMVVGAVSTQAEESKDLQEIFENCGLGALIFPEWPIGASVSNFTWDWGTTATTSGLTTPDACAGRSAVVAAFIHRTYDSIEEDLAHGNGKYLEMLGRLCDKSPDESVAFVEQVRDGFREMVAAGGYSELDRLEKSKMLYQLVMECAV